MQYLEEALALQTALVDDDRQNRQLRSDVASTQHFIAVSLTKLNRPLEALSHLDAAIALRESMLAEDGRDARTRNLLAGNYAEQSKVDETTLECQSCTHRATDAELENYWLDNHPFWIRHLIVETAENRGHLA